MWKVIMLTLSHYQVFKHQKLRSILQGLSVHLVEASLSLSAIQERTLLTASSHAPSETAASNYAPVQTPSDGSSHTPIQPAVSNHTPSGHAHYKTSQVDGVEVFWYQQLTDVPQGAYRGPCLIQDSVFLWVRVINCTNIYY